MLAPVCSHWIGCGVQKKRQYLQCVRAVLTTAQLMSVRRRLVILKLKSARELTGQPPITTLIKQRRLKPFGHVVRADQEAEDHSRALRASLNPPGNWRRPTGRPRQTWQRTISDDLIHLSLALHSADRQAKYRPSWWMIVETATLTYRCSTAGVVVGRCAGGRGE